MVSIDEEFQAAKAAQAAIKVLLTTTFNSTVVKTLRKANQAAILNLSSGGALNEARGNVGIALSNLALLWQIFAGVGFPNQFFYDSWVVGFWRGRPWLAGRRIGEASLHAGSSRFWIGWVTEREDKCVRSTCRG